MEHASLMLGCHACHRVHEISRADRVMEQTNCNRCGARLHYRKPNSLSRSWAFLIAATVLYIPANTYPIMNVVQLGQGTPDTILSGVARLVESGLWPLALLVFVASVAIPILKILAIGFLLLSVNARSRFDPVARTRLYRIVELVGRWSMVDIFMVSILIALVRLGNLAEITPGVGAMAFASVVVLTMLSAMSFDPRLIWDEHGWNNTGVIRRT